MSATATKPAAGKRDGEGLSQTEREALETGATLDELFVELGISKRSIAAIAAELDIDPALCTPTDEQRQRARDAEKAKSGLRGKALGLWVVTGASNGGKEPEPKPSPRSASSGPREGSTLHAAIVVLKRARTPMKGADVYAKIAAEGLAPGLKGKTPEATVTAALNVAAKNEQHGIFRPEPGKFSIKRDS